MRNFSEIFDKRTDDKNSSLRNNKKKLLDKYQVLWCSGYHVCFTRRRSQVRAWTASENQLSLKWIIRNVQRFCSLEIIFQLTPEKLPNTWRKFIETCEIFPKFSTNALMIKIPVCETTKRSYLTNIRCCGVAVITSASHAGLQFDPGQHQKVNYHENEE